MLKILFEEGITITGHDILKLPKSCQQVKEDNLPPHWGSNQRTSVCEANALPLTPQRTVKAYPPIFQFYELASRIDPQIEFLEHYFY